MIKQDEVEEIFHRILEAIMPYQGHNNFDNILEALKDAVSFQMACACPVCRKRLASKLRQDIPAMLVKADRLHAGSGTTITCNLH